MSDNIKEKMKNIYYKLKMNFHYGNIMKVLFICFTVMLIFHCLDITAHADGFLNYSGKDSPFDKVTKGWGQFMNEKYRNNYHLDPGDIGSLDLIGKAMNSVSNFFFSTAVFISWIGLNVFNLCFNNSITGEFAKVLDSLSRAFTDGVFNKFFLIMFMFSMISVVIMFAKRNFAAIFSQFLAVVIILVSVFIISSTGARNFVVDTTQFSKNIGSTLVASMNEEANGGNFSDSSTSQMLGTMWGNLVQSPWIVLEFNGAKSTEFDETPKTDKDLYENILSKPSGDDSRENDTKDVIGQVDMASRMGASVILTIITIVKVFVIIVLGVLQIFLQIVAIAIILVSPLIFLLAIVPQFGGTDLLKWMFDKFLGVQLGIILLSFVISLMLLVDTVTLKFFMGLGASFTVAMVIQSVCWVLVIVFRKQIMNSIMEFQNKIGKGTAKYLSPGHKMLNGGAKAGEKISNKVTEPVKKGAVNVKDNLAYGGKYVSTYGKNKVKLYGAQKMSNVIDKVNSKFKRKDGTGKENFEKTKSDEQQTQKENINKNYKGEPIDFETLKNKKREEKETENIKSKNDNKVDKHHSKFNEFDKLYKEIKDKNNNKISEEKNNIKNTELNDMNNPKKDSLNTEKNIKDETPNVVDLNEERTKKGKDLVDSEAIKEDTRKSLNNENKKITNKENINKNTGGTKIENSKSNTIKKDKKVSIERAEKLKTFLGVNDKQLKSKERKYNRELKKLKIEKRRKKLNIKLNKKDIRIR